MRGSFQWDLGVAVLSEYDADGFIGVGLDHYGEKLAGVDPGELHSAYGHLSRPLDPEVDNQGNVPPGRGCNAWYAWEGSQLHVKFGSDPRVIQNLPTLQKGESLDHGAANNFTRYYADGSVATMTTSDATPTGQSVFTKLAPSGRSHQGPWGQETFDPNGYHLRTASGARIDMGGIGGLPAPLSAIGSYFIAAAASCKLRSSIIALGPDAGVFDPVAKSTPTLAVLNAFSTVLAALKIAATGGPSGGLASASPGSPVVATPDLGAAITAAIAAVAAAAATLPSASTTVT